jgi:hypothetical protein
MCLCLHMRILLCPPCRKLFECIVLAVSSSYIPIVCVCNVSIVDDIDITITLCKFTVLGEVMVLVGCGRIIENQPNALNFNRPPRTPATIHTWSMNCMHIISSSISDTN